MEKQIIISVSREYGSGGRDIAQKIAENFGLTLYDRNILQEIAKHQNLPIEELKRYDEAPKRPLESRRIGKYSNSFEDVVAEFQFKFLKAKAQAGESFVVVGRCADVALNDYGCLVSVYVTAEQQFRVARIAETENLSKAEALSRIRKIDKKRTQYYHRHSEGRRWGDSDNYDLCIKSNKLGIPRTTDLLESYIRERMSAESSGMND